MNMSRWVASLAVSLGLAGCSIDAEKVDGKNAADFAATAHTHAGTDITGKVATAGAADIAPWTGLTDVPATFPPSAHDHLGSEVTTQVASAAVTDAAPWSGLTGVPSTFPPSTHGHPGSEVTSQVASAASADAVAWGGVTGTPSTYPASVHGHTGAQVTSQVASAASADSVPWGGVTGKPVFATPFRVTDGAGAVLGAYLGIIGSGWDTHIQFIDESGIIWMLQARDGVYMSSAAYGFAYFQSTGCNGSMLLSDWELDQAAVYFAGNTYIGTGVMRSTMAYASRRDPAGSCTNISGSEELRPVQLLRPMPSAAAVPVRIIL